MSAEVIWSGWEATNGGSYVALPRVQVCGVSFHLRVKDARELELANEEQITRTTRVVEFLSHSVDDRMSDLREPFDRVPYDDDRFSWAANQFFDEFAGDTTSVYVLVGEDRMPVVKEQLKPVDIPAMVGPIWCPVANMVEERPYGPGGQEKKRGSKHFAPGAKLYCDDCYWGTSYDQVRVVGHHRRTHRYVTMVISSAWLTNWRVELAYSPYVIRALWPTWDGTPPKKERAQQVVDGMRKREAAGSQQ